ncbi:peptidoglycan DD-metalloendopeptidase family protein [Luteolibacter sp. Populi]|uniref:peptidoglycan DD-metalloendopeptidase family protein n=1 Tax=Luteolibacter sp. Populi TaxID=3230487 RepID=UPI003466695B
MRIPSPPLATCLAAAGMIGLALWLDRPPVELPVEALTGFQDADAPLFLPADAKLRAHGFPAWQLAQVPEARRFEAPLGSEQGALTFRDAEGNLNGIGGANSDLGDPVFAVADGLAVFAGEVSPEQGKTVVLAHRTVDGRMLQSEYAGLQRMDVAAGDLVPRGKAIGTVGTANGHHAARLDFAMREGDGLRPGAVPIELPQEAVAGDLAPAPLGVAVGAK